MKKVLLSLFIVFILFTFSGCGFNKGEDDIELEVNAISFTSPDGKDFVSFSGEGFEKDRLLSKIVNEKLGLSIAISFETMTKDQYDYAKQYNFLGYPKTIKEYTWNNYEGYTYDKGETDLTLRIKLNEENDYVTCLFGYVVVSDGKNIDEVFDSEEVQNLLNSVGYKKLSDDSN